MELIDLLNRRFVRHRFFKMGLIILLFFVIVPQSILKAQAGVDKCVLLVKGGSIFTWYGQPVDLKDAVVKVNNTRVNYDSLSKSFVFNKTVQMKDSITIEVSHTLYEKQKRKIALTYLKEKEYLFYLGKTGDYYISFKNSIYPVKPEPNAIGVFFARKDKKTVQEFIAGLKPDSFYLEEIPAKYNPQYSFAAKLYFKPDSLPDYNCNLLAQIRKCPFVVGAGPVIGNSYKNMKVWSPLVYVGFKRGLKRDDAEVILYSTAHLAGRVYLESVAASADDPIGYIGTSRFEPGTYNGIFKTLNTITDHPKVYNANLGMMQVKKESD